MPRPAFNTLAQGRIAVIAEHTEDLPIVAEVPSEHFGRTSSDSWNLLVYLERNLNRTNIYGTAYGRHMARVNKMVLLSLCAAFERFLKELAAVCVDHLALRVLDNRLDELSQRGSTFAAHFEAHALGRAMCESVTWLDCDEVNIRFRKILSLDDPNDRFYVFPEKGNQLPTAEQWRYRTMSNLWQLRHTIAHNDGVITRSDALKLRLLIKAPVESPKVICPTKDDIRSVKRFLEETADSINSRVADRLASCLEQLYDADNSLFVPATEAAALAPKFKRPVTIAGQTVNPP